MTLHCIRSLIEIPAHCLVNTTVYLGEFTTFAKHEQKLIHDLEKETLKRGQELIIINLSHSNLDSEVYRFRSLNDTKQLLAKFFPNLRWYDYTPVNSHDLAKLKQEITLFLPTQPEMNFRLSGPLAEKLDSFNWSQKDEKIWELINLENQQIYDYLIAGKTKAANIKLNYYFFLSGCIVCDTQQGSKIGFPTINIEINRQYFYPKLGCYVTVTRFDSQEMYFGLTCLIEKRPGEFYFETYLQNFQKKVYRRYVQTYFLDFYRENEPIKSLAELKKLITADLKHLTPVPVLTKKMLV